MKHWTKHYVHALPANTAEDKLLEALGILAEDPTVHGILVQMPLPAPLNAARVLRAVPPEKDVDGLTEVDLRRLAAGLPGLRPCTPLGVMELLKAYEIQITGKQAVVLGRSRLVGVPMLLMLGRKGVDATATLAHSRTADLADLTREADILAAAGSPGLIGAEHVKPGAAVFDVGVSRSKDGKIAGDVRFKEVRRAAGAVTPMPGGTGPMTVACLLANTVRAAAAQGVVRRCRTEGTGIAPHGRAHALPQDAEAAGGAAEGRTARHGPRPDRRRQGQPGRGGSARLYDTLSKLVGGEQALGECLRATTLPLDEPVPEVAFEGRKFCLTGNFSGDRKGCAAHIEARGGTIQTAVSGKTDYLVIGEYASPAWKQSSYGGKIEKAVELKAAGKGVKIISEEALLEKF